MARHNDRRNGWKLESLEGRNLQSALAVGTGPAVVVGSGPDSAVIGANSAQSQPTVQYHSYHTAVGFFGQ